MVSAFQPFEMFHTEAGSSSFLGITIHCPLFLLVETNLVRRISIQQMHGDILLFCKLGHLVIFKSRVLDSATRIWVCRRELDGSHL
jgi:hypothetical protein